MSAYGYHRETTPFISRWANEATLFKRLQAESNFTGPACSSLMTGKRVWTHGKFDPHAHGSKPANSEVENLALELKKNGYYTMAFIQNRVALVEALGISSSFAIAPPPTEFIEPATLAASAKKWLQQMFGSRIRLYNWILLENFMLSRLLKRISGDTTETKYSPEKVFNSFFDVFDDGIKEPFFAWIHSSPPTILIFRRPRIWVFLKLHLS
jgi:hypothetical protein